MASLMSSSSAMSWMPSSGASSEEPLSRKDKIITIPTNRDDINMQGFKNEQRGSPLEKGCQGKDIFTVRGCETYCRKLPETP